MPEQTPLEIPNEVKKRFFEELKHIVGPILLDHGNFIAVIAVVFGVVSLLFWASNADEIIDLSRQSLGNEREPTPQKFKGIESLILSAFDDTPNGAPPTREMSGEVQDVFDQIEKGLAHFVDTIDGKALNSRRSTSITDHLVVVS